MQGPRVDEIRPRLVNKRFLSATVCDVAGK